jgi:hypothetical protein
MTLLWSTLILGKEGEALDVISGGPWVFIYLRERFSLVGYGTIGQIYKNRMYNFQRESVSSSVYYLVPSTVQGERGVKGLHLLQIIEEVVVMTLCRIWK